MTATAASIQIRLDAQTAELKKGMAEGRKAINNLGKGMSGSVAMGMAKFTAGLAAVKAALASVRGAINAVSMAMGELDETAKFASRIGASADQLTILGFAAEQTGASTRTMNMGLQRMTRRISEAAAGTGEAQGALRELGLSAEYLAGLAPDEQFGAIADAMAHVTQQGEKVRLAMKLFDSEGVALVNTLAGGSAQLDEFGRKAEEMGLLLGDNRATVEAANDAINRMKRSWGALVQRVAIAVAPALEAIANVLAKIVGAFNKLFGLGGEAETFGGHARKAAEAFVPPAEKAVEKVSDTFKRKADEVTAKAKRAVRQIAMTETPGIGAVTRRSGAGFSALQEARRAQQDRARHQRELLEALGRVETAVRESSITVEPVRVLT